ncbi:MAG TPA: hypothetical protein VD998_02635 [Verrucomicrobiae bacterium]|nr:hypothetical protein [Verrucomicrobiae bacterium]
MFRESDYENDDLEETENLNESRFTSFGVKSAVEEGEVEHSDMIKAVREEHQELYDKLDDETNAIVDAIISSVEVHFDPEDANDKWIKILEALHSDVLVPYRKGDADMAQSALVDLETKVEKML